MRTSALQYLACPQCGGTLVADTGPPSHDGHIMHGTLVSSCGARFPIRDGIPRLVLPRSSQVPDAGSLITAARFAAEWTIFDYRASYYEQQFLDWIAPLVPRDFTDRVVFEGGCGKGRHTALIARYGAKAVVALDLGDAVNVAFAATRHLANVHIAQGDLVQPPVARAFDIGFSIGVLHHLSEPQAGFRSLYDRVRTGGRVAIWVYGYESNEWIVRFVDPIRDSITSRMPERLLYWCSLPPAAALHTALRLYRVPAMADRLPYGTYLEYISRFPFREVHHIVFDQLVTPVAHYLRREEVERWFATPDLDEVTLAWHNCNSWRGSATVCSHADAGARDRREAST
ncbi:MAG: methyltransferase domain-containing protein [Proteobacteria bacterium]|nr:methyltransferase domain-containing protein [Pseudomonadota bacterium]